MKKKMIFFLKMNIVEDYTSKKYYRVRTMFSGVGLGTIWLIINTHSLSWLSMVSHRREKLHHLSEGYINYLIVLNKRLPVAKQEEGKLSN